jgi:hypothetical protein
MAYLKFPRFCPTVFSEDERCLCLLPNVNGHLGPALAASAEEWPPIELAFPENAVSRLSGLLLRPDLVICSAERSTRVDQSNQCDQVA